ncbi:unnamed protein product [Oppiella nova]|uniref:RRM domain-containing protein n=1 Tax=Oppiella nova TaxID=334625 RepID=A0A7R9QP03_9ACAR|nr:unnamed protein product [Oppiella nova]CAG2170287.1 unnamed protein product [Oppiella nova]
MDSMDETHDQHMDEHQEPEDHSGSDGDSSDDSDDANEELNAQEINRLQEELAVNSYDYQKHIELIDRLESSDDLELIRTARERMSRVYPLTPNLWLKWINDEIRMASNADEKMNIIALFERSLNDYISIDLWLEYVQYSIGLMDALTVDGVRRIFERSLTYVGLNVDKGVLVWDTFREFESFILRSMTSTQCELNDEIKRQLDRIFDLFRRQLSVPLIGMDNTYSECQNWCQSVKEKFSVDLNVAAVKTGYEKACKELAKLVAYEESLTNSEAPHYEQYVRYIEYETTNGTPTRVQCIYERALIENCLIADLWHKYTTYLDKKVVIDTIILPVYERAVRNCTWSSLLWISYMRALERLKCGHQKVMEAFESALVAGFQEPNEYLQIWLTYLDGLRRKTNWKDESEVKSLRNTFEKGVQHLAAVEGADPTCTVWQYWAKVEAKYCSNIDRARELWNELITSRPDIASQAQTWLSYSRLERLFGDDKHYRKVLMRGLTTSTDWPESVGQILLEYEREEGVSIESFDEAMNKYENVMKKANERRVKNAEREAEEKKREKASKKYEKYELKRASKRKAEQTPTGATEAKQKPAPDVDSDGFKVPQTSGSSSVSTPKKVRVEASEQSTTQSKPREERDRNVNRREDNREDKRGEAPAHGVSYKGDGTKDLQTVFVSNLDFKISEKELRDAFEKFGVVDDVRLVRNYKGLSKGYAYVEYSSIESVREALKHDRMPLEGRPAFISEMGKRSKFGFSTSVEKHKIFVKNLAPEVTTEDLKKVFEKYGTLKDVRLVTYRNGHSKGCAYVEFNDESTALLAVKESDGQLVADRNISVAISNPNVKSNPREDRDPIQNFNGNPTESSRYSKTRIDAPMIPMALRRQNAIRRRPQNGSTDSSASGSNSSGSALSNNDFRNLLLGNK